MAPDPISPHDSFPRAKGPAATAPLLSCVLLILASLNSELRMHLCHVAVLLGSYLGTSTYVYIFKNYALWMSVLPHTCL